MKTHDYRDSDGHLVSFEIRNIGRSRGERFLKRVFPAATIERRRSDDFATIELNGRRFILNEPWGDSSRYMIHQEPPQPSTELDELRHAFAQYQPSWFFSGDRSFAVLVLTLAVLLCISVLVIWLS